MKISAAAIYAWYRQTIRHPRYRWWIILGTLVYLISPIDISPDVVPILGQLDDAVLLTVLVSELSQVLLDGFKARKQGSSKDPAAADQDATVEVEAVPVQE